MQIYYSYRLKNLYTELVGVDVGVIFGVAVGVTAGAVLGEIVWLGVGLSEHTLQSCWA